MTSHPVLGDKNTQNTRAFYIHTHAQRYYLHLHLHNSGHYIRTHHQEARLRSKGQADLKALPSIKLAPVSLHVRARSISHAGPTISLLPSLVSDWQRGDSSKDRKVRREAQTPVKETWPR